MSTLLLFASAQTKFWGSMVILFIVGLGYIANKVTRGTTLSYLYYEMNANVKKTLMYTHGFGSLILALMIPNNFLNKIEFIGKLYEEQQLWIAGTMVMLLFLFLILFGVTFTLLARALGFRKVNDEAGTITSNE